MNEQATGIIQQMQDLMQQAQNQGQQPGQQQFNWQGQNLSVHPEIQKVNVPIKLQTPLGSIRIYLEFGPEWGESAEKLQELLGYLNNTGVPLDIWQGKQYQQGWGNNQRQNYGYNRGYRKF